MVAMGAAGKWRRGLCRIPGSTESNLNRSNYLAGTFFTRTNRWHARLPGSAQRRHNTGRQPQWILDRLRELAKLFAINVCGSSAMSNHLHLVLRRPSTCFRSNLKAMLAVVKKRFGCLADSDRMT